MQNTLSIAADDFGLTRRVTDTILQVVDGGPVRLVSIVANGEAVEYALTEYKKRANILALAVHLNLTEGKTLSAPEEVPHLVDSRGMFKNSVAGLWLSYTFGSRTKRAALRAEVRREAVAQIGSIREALGGESLAVNGHQHVHMLPFVFEEVMTIGGVVAVRITREPLFFCGVPSPINMVARFMLSVLSRRLMHSARARGVRTNDWFVGLLYSGRMTEKILRAGLARAQGGSVEALFHPGSAAEGELAEWKKGRADVAWHYSPWRERERATLGGMTFPLK